MEALKMIPYLALIVAITGIILGSGMISLAEFGGTMTTCFNTSYTWNETVQRCHAPAGEAQITTGEDNVLNMTREFYTVWESQDGIESISEQTPTVSIIAVMTIIISIISGVFVYLNYLR
jgi:hypothetical protein